MVASTHNHGELTLNQQQQQFHYQDKHLSYYTNNNNNNINNYSNHHQSPVCRSSQSAQDKRSRLSNVINNLKRKVPESVVSRDSVKTIDNEDRNSVERNLETLEKYVMTVLNGVIKDAETEGRVGSGGINGMIETEDSSRLKAPADSKEQVRIIADESDGINPVGHEPSEPSAVEPAVPDGNKIADKNDISGRKKEEENKIEDVGTSYCEFKTSKLSEGSRDTEVSVKTKDLNVSSSSPSSSSSSASLNVTAAATKTLDVIESSSDNPDADTAIPKAVTSEDNADPADPSEHQTGVKFFSNKCNFASSEGIRSICRDLLNDLLNDIVQCEHSIDNHPPQSVGSLGFHCSLPLDKVAPVLKFCEPDGYPASLQISPKSSVPSCIPTPSPTPTPTPTPSSSASPSSTSSPAPSTSPKSTSPTVRHLCLYCDRKFLSISLRQRHTERVHQLKGVGRRSERNSRKSSQSCQYCTDKCSSSGSGDNLEGLFQHMIACHSDKYHACIQCSTRYSTKEALNVHTRDFHSNCNSSGTVNVERTTSSSESLDRSKDVVTVKESLCTRDSPEQQTHQSYDDKRRIEMSSTTATTITTTNITTTTTITTTSTAPTLTKLNIFPRLLANKDFSNPASPEFDSSFYSSVSCNIRENLLHHIDGKLLSNSSINETKQLPPQLPQPPPNSQSQSQSQTQSQSQQHYQTFHEPVSQIQFPIDISLTAATPVDSKEYSPSDKCENSISKYAQKPGKTSRSHPRRVSFEKYNFPRKYDGKEQWTCSIKDLSKFDIYTQLTLRKKQQVIKEKITQNRLSIQQSSSLSMSITTTNAIDPGQTDFKEDPMIESSDADATTRLTEDKTVCSAASIDAIDTIVADADTVSKDSDKNHHSILNSNNLNSVSTETNTGTNTNNKKSSTTEFTHEFSNFIKLKRWDECPAKVGKTDEIVYAELTGEWSRPRVYICGACSSRYLTLKEIEDHKLLAHPHVWCSHFEFTGDQRELYKHLFLPGHSSSPAAGTPTTATSAKAKNLAVDDRVCTKCSKLCSTLSELHRHMLECGGDQAWLLGLFGKGKKKCKWRPFGSRSRRRRQRGMKRNIQNSQTTRVNQPREKQPSGPRVRPSDHESIQKMLANLPPKRSTRRDVQETAQSRPRKVQTRSKLSADTSNTRLSSKTVLRNKLLKNAKLFQRKRCRGDNITAAIESVISNYKSTDAVTNNLDNNNDNNNKQQYDNDGESSNGRGTSISGSKELKETEKFESSPESQRRTSAAVQVDKNAKLNNRSGEFSGRVRVVSKKKNVKINFKRTNAAFKSTVASSNITKQQQKVQTANQTNKIKGTLKRSTIKTTTASANSLLTQKNDTIKLRKRKTANPSLSHASIKAKSQLRSQDGKFARDPQQSTSLRRGSSSVSVTSETSNSPRIQHSDSSSSLVTRSRVKTVVGNSDKQNLSRNGELVKRVTRVSSDDKMPTLEADGLTTVKATEAAEKLSDLPILSPITSTSRNSRAKTLNSVSKNNNLLRKKNKINNNNNSVKSMGARGKQKQIGAKKMNKSVDSGPGSNNNNNNNNSNNSNSNSNNNESSSEKVELTVEEKDDVSLKQGRDRRVRKGKSLSPRVSSATTDDKDDSLVKRQDSSLEDTKFAEDDSSASGDMKKNSKVLLVGSDKKNEINKVESRKARQERRAGSLEELSNLQQVPLEVKKLLGPTDDLFSQMGIAPPVKVFSGRGRGRGRRRRGLNRFNATRVNNKIITRQNKADDINKQEPAELFNKTSDKIDKSVGKKVTRSEKKSSSEVIDKIKEIIHLPEKISAADVEDNKSAEVITSNDDNSSKVGSVIGRSLRRRKSSIDVDASSIKALESTATGLPSTMVPVKSVNNCDKETDNEGEGAVPEQREQEKNKEAKEEADAAAASASAADDSKNDDDYDEDYEDNESEEKKKLVTADLVSLSFEHLQQESSNSNIDSGKENSSETPVNISKPKVSRPKKSRGSKRDRVVKRTLNNVIGILTEGVNIPVEVQQSVVLTVQTSIDNNISLNTGINNNNNGNTNTNTNANTNSNSNSNNNHNNGGNSAPAVQNNRTELGGDNNNAADNANAVVVSNSAANENIVDVARNMIECVANDGKDETASQEIQRDVNSSDDNSEPRVADTQVELSQADNAICKSDTSPALTAAPVSAPVPTPAPANAEPTNDIILDLSRRKPRGKGSFLEKIVSKIAKQKDALLEGEVGSLLDHAVDELSIILDEVGPTLEATTTSTTTNTDTSTATVKLAGKKDEAEGCGGGKSESSDDKSFIDTENGNKGAEFIERELENKNKEQEIPLVLEQELKKDKTENTLIIRESLPTQGSLNTNLLESITSNDTQCNDTLKSNDKVIIGTCEVNKKKRSLEIVETKNKRKSVEEDELECNRIEEDLCLADIMKLINNAKRESSSEVANEISEGIRPGKRKNIDSKIKGDDNDYKEGKVLSTGDKSDGKTDVLYANKKTKLCDEDKDDKILGEVENIKAGCDINNLQAQKIEKLDDKIIIDSVKVLSDLPVKPSPKRKTKSKEFIASDKFNLNEQVAPKDSVSNLNAASITEITSTSISTSSSSCNINNSDNVESSNEISLSIDQTILYVSKAEEFKIDDKPIKSKKRRGKKRSLANEHLQLPEDKSIGDINNTVTELTKETEPVDESLKTPEDQIRVQVQVQQTKTRGSKKKSLNDHSTEDKTAAANLRKKSKERRDVSSGADSNQNDSKEKLISEPRPRGRRPKRKPSDADVTFQIPASKDTKQSNDADNINDTLIERRKTLKRKAKENVFLIEDLLDFGDDLDSDSESVAAAVKISQTNDRSSEEVSKESDKMETGLENKPTENIEPVKADKKIVSGTDEALEPQPAAAEVVEEGAVAGAETEAKAGVVAADESGTENAENQIEDSSSLKKRASGNFAVVHTKSGEILIVEKKKKFTKEAAKFFCEVCTTSFTRKSSLKKHNLSQSHLIQVSKIAGIDQENGINQQQNQQQQEESMSHDDATVSSIDRCETVTGNSEADASQALTSASITQENKDKDDTEKTHSSADDRDKKDDEFKGILPKEPLNEVAQQDLPQSNTEDTSIKASSLNPPLQTSDLEDELLDEEISKITENMTHDEYVLTDQISPLPDGTSTPLKQTADSLSEVQRKINLADEHLDLDSPPLADKIITQVHSNKDNDVNASFNSAINNLVDKLEHKQVINNKYEDNLSTDLLPTKNNTDQLVMLDKISLLSSTVLTSSQLVTSDSKLSLDFSNITEKLKSNEFIKNNKNSSLIEFDSDEDSRKSVSRDIQKLLSAEQSNLGGEYEDNGGDKNLSCDIETKSEDVTKKKKKEKEKEKGLIVGINKNFVDDNVKDNSFDLNIKVSKSRVKKSRGNKKKKFTEGSNNSSSDSEYDNDKKDTAGQNKSKIVKSVFGRVLTAGEKADKVKEVLDDWVSKSDSDSHDDRTNNWRNWNNDKKNSKLEKSGKAKNQTQNKKIDQSISGSLEGKSSSLMSEHNEFTNSRCRQSKKRAEERISRAFEEESIPYELAYEISKHSNLVKNSKDKEKDENVYDFIEESVKSCDKLNNKSKDEFINKILANNDEADDKNDDELMSINNQDNCLKDLDNDKINKADEFLFNDTNSLESIHTRVPSCPRERSSTPDMVSLTTRDSENDIEAPTDIDNDNDNNFDNDNDNNDIENEEEEEEDIVCGRLSPSYASNLPDSSRDSATTVSKDNNEDNEDDDNEDDESIKITRRCSSEFSGEKIIIRSSNEESRSGVVTIAPTDAIEDNALDVPPQETQELTKKSSREGKVLNFDEELFVECCSRLKATTENELRGAKKIKLDHTDNYSKDGNQDNRNRAHWKDVESQNSLGSLLESVNQLLGEEMYNNRENDYQKRNRSLRSSERLSPVSEVQTDFVRPENLSYEDSLDVAFEHNNKLRDKIQQRMRESENLIATTFAHKNDTNISTNTHPNTNTNYNYNNNDDRRHHHHHHHHHRNHHHRHSHRKDKSYDNSNNSEAFIALNDDADGYDRDKETKSITGESMAIKNKIESNFDGLLDKALSNILHNNGKHDHNGSTPMNVLAELACAQVPTSTISEVKINREKLSKIKSFSPSNDNDWTSLQSNDKADKDQPKKPLRNPIKELFERKNELNDRKHHHHHHHHHYHQQQQQEKFSSLNFQSDSFGLKQHNNKNKKIKRQDDEYHPLIRKSPFGIGMQERKKRRGDKKRVDVQNKVKDVYEFDDEESQAESGFNSTLSLYRSRSEKSYEVNCVKTKEINVGDLVSKTITKSLDADKPADSMDKRLESMIERKFKEMESSIPKTKGALKSFNLEERQQQQQQQSITGPMDSFVERKRSKRTGESTAKHKSKKRSKNSKKRSRNAWYEDDSSDEFVTAIKADGIGVGISKSQRTCSKGKQNLFAELSSSSDSEYEDRDELKNLFRDNRTSDGPIGEMPDGGISSKADGEFNKSNEEADVDWISGAHSREESRHEFDNKKNVSESDMSDRPLIIDERKESEHDDVSVNGNDNYIYQANNDNDNDNDNAEDDDETDNRSEAAFELDDLYREDSSVIASDSDDSGNDDDKNTEIEKDNYHDDNKEKNEFIPLDKALDLLDNTDTDNDESIPLEKALALLDSTDNVEKIFDGSAVRCRSRSKSKSKSKSRSASPQEKINYEEVESKLSIANDDCDDDNDDLADDLPEKLTTNEKPEEKPSDNLPLHVFLSRKVQESKKRKEEQLKKLKKQEEEEEERAALSINMEFQSTRRQRKCAIGKQGLLAEISSSDEEYYFKETGKRGANDKIDNGCDKSRRQKRESKEKKKERYIEKKHEQMIAKEQKAIEEEILRELELKRDATNKELDVGIDIGADADADVDANAVAVAAPVVNKDAGGKKNLSKDVISEGDSAKRKHRVSKKISGDFKSNKDKDKFSSDTENKCEKSTEVKKNKNNISAGKKESQSRNSSNTNSNSNSNSNNSNGNGISNSNNSNTGSGKKSGVRTNRKSANKRNNKSTHENSRTNGSGTDDEELRTTKSWNKVEEGVGVAIGRRKRAAANQLYYWSSSSDDDEEFIQPSKTVEEEDDRQEQHGWIVGDSHKKMITMLAMEKKLKEKRRRSEDDCNGKSKNKKHRNSTS